MSDLIEKLDNLVGDVRTLNAATCGKKFSTYHEAYAVMLQRAEEAAEMILMVRDAMTKVWAQTKEGDGVGIDVLGEIYQAAVNGADRMIFVAADADKAAGGVVHGGKPAEVPDGE